MLRGFSPDRDWVAFAAKNRLLEDRIPYGRVRNPWQIDVDLALTTRQFVYLCCARGHSRTDSFTYWALVLLTTTPGISGLACGADHDNAKLYLRSAEKLIALHPHLFSGCSVTRTAITYTHPHQGWTSYIDVISSDAGSAFGHNVDLYILGDLHSWKGENGRKFFEALITTIHKRPHARCWIESNALVLSSENAEWHKPFRDWVEGNPEWFYWKAPGFVASWSREKILKQSAFLNPLAYAQLINNEDVSGSEQFITREQVEGIEVLEGPAPPRTKEDRNGLVVVTADLGHVHDATAIAAVHALPVHRGGMPRFNLLRLDTLVGSHRNPVLGSDVEKRIREFCDLYRPFRVLVDKHQALHMIQANYGWEAVNFTRAYNIAITEALYTAVTAKQLSIYPRAGQGIHTDQHSGRKDSWDLKRELLSAIIRDNRAGKFQMDHQKDGFNDRMVAVAMGIHACLSEDFAPLLREQAAVKQEQHYMATGKGMIERMQTRAKEAQYD